MNIFQMNLHSLSNNAIALFKENLLPTLTTQQKKIVLIASCALGFLVTCFAITYYSLKQKKVMSPVPACELPVKDEIKSANNKKEVKDNPLNSNANLSGSKKLNFTKFIIWEGSVLNGKFTGKGQISYPSSVEKGEFKDGLLNGKGKITYDNMSVHEGQFKNGLLHGKGKRITASGITQEGVFVNGCFIP